jgi:hypothetical protein
MIEKAKFAADAVVSTTAISSPWWVPSLTGAHAIGQVILVYLGIALAVLRIRAWLRGRKPEGE